MFKTLLLKEIHEAVLNFRFWLVAVLCLLLIPFGLFISSKDYQSKLKECQQEKNTYFTKNEGKINSNTTGEGIFTPSPLSILSSGFGEYLPYKAVTSNNGFAKTEKKQQDNNLQSVLFGKIDFVFIVTNFLSLLALIFTFGSISTEKEMGTIRLVLSNPVNRWKVILAKVCGNFIVFLAPFFMGLIIGLIIVQLVTSVSLLSSQYIPAVAMILIFTLLFLFLFFNMGIWASVIAKNTITSIVVLLFVWIFFSTVIPRVSPMVAQLVYPVKTEDAHKKDYENLHWQIQQEYDNERSELLENLAIKYNINFRDGAINMNDLAEQTNYTELVIPIDKKYKDRFNKELNELEKAWLQSRDRQMTIASNLSRVSPVSSYSFVTTELCNTGLLELQNRQEAARKFQYQVNQDVYSLYIHKRYLLKGSTSTSTNLKEGVNYQDIKVPQMTEHSGIRLSAVFQKTWPDIVLLIWYTVFFFTGAFISFLRFDVR